MFSVYVAVAAAVCLASLATAIECPAVTSPVNCGGITSDHCAAMDCCWSDTPGSNPPCTFANTTGTPITTVHLVQSNHFDAGYANLTISVVNEYFDIYFPLAAQVCIECNASYPLRWMTQGWLVALYVNCPLDAGLHCPEPAQLAAFHDAVAKKCVTWHAFPHNAHLETARPGIIAAGVDLVHALDAMFFVPAKVVLSQRDVPGMTATALPVFQERGIRAISIGANGRMVAPALPSVFWWSPSVVSTASLPALLQRVVPASPVSPAAPLLTFMHNRGYGSFGEAYNYAQLPNFAEAMVYAWRGDNAGPPPTADSVAADFLAAKALFPRASVISSSLEDFYSAIVQAGPSATSGIPTVTKDAGNTWNIGDAQDPLKHAFNRAIDRVLAWCGADPGHCGATDAQLANFTRFFVKNCEHTFGISISWFGKYATSDWSNKDFIKDLAENHKEFQISQQSWVEQRVVGLYWAQAALGSSPFSAMVNSALDEVRAVSKPVATDSWTEVTLDTPITLQTQSSVNVTLTFNASTGRLVDIASLISGEFGGVSYQTMNDGDFATHYRAQFLIPGSGGENEYGKENDDNSTSASALWHPQFEAAFVSPDKSTVVIQAAFAANLTESYGAPSRVFTAVQLTGLNSLNITTTVVNKTATRLPEALYATFQVDGAADYLIEVHGQWRPACNGTVVAGARGLRGITDFVAAIHPSRPSVLVRAVDSGLVRLGARSGPFPDPAQSEPDMTQGLHFVLHANSWSTNFAYWYPFAGGEETRATPDGRFAADAGWRWTLTWE